MLIEIDEYGFSQDTTKPLKEQIVDFFSNSQIKTICNACDGDGAIDCIHCDGFGVLEYDCEHCDGQGCEDCWDGTVDEDCEHCDGQGEFDCKACNSTGEIWFKLNELFSSKE